MAKKAGKGRGAARTSGRGGAKSAKGSAKSAARSRTGAAAKAGRRGGQAATKTRAKAGAKSGAKAGAKAGGRAKAASGRAGGARAKAAPAAKRAYKDRQQPETLRLKSLSASLTADDVEASSKFYVDGLGFHVKQRWEEEGKLLGLELVAGSCMIGISQDDWAKGRNRTKGVGLSIYAESSQGIDKVAERLRANGVDFEGPTTTEWGWRQVSAKDPDGFRIIVYETPKSGG